MLDINAPAEVGEDNKDILSEEEDILNMDMPVEVGENNKEKDKEIWLVLLSGFSAVIAKAREEVE
jgi:hypothetical protein